MYNRLTDTVQYSGTENIVNTVYYFDEYRQKVVYDPEGECIIYDYDIDGNLKVKRTYPMTDASVEWYERYTYDVYGNMITQTDANGNTTTYTYDGQNRVATCKNALNETTSYSYDDLGNLVKITYPNNKAVEYTYDLYGNMTKFTNQLGQYETYTYDNSGNVKTYRNLSGKTTIYTYNYELEDGEKNYLTKYKLTSTDTNEREGIKYEYDIFGNTVRECYIYQSYSSGAWQEPEESYRSVYTYTYTFDNRLESETKKNAYPECDDRTITYTYDVNGNITKAVTHFGDVYNYVYDGLGRCTEIVGVESYHYNKDSTLSYSEGANNVYYTYDGLNRPTSKTVEYIGDEYYINAYTYDDAGNILSDTEAMKDKDSDEESYVNNKYYTYDKLNRIKRETDNGKNINYTYDSVGNVTYKDYSYASSADVKIEYEGTLRTYEDYVSIFHYEYFTYDNANKLTSSYTELWYTDPVEWLDNCSIFPYTYTYDTNGNLTKKQTNSKSEVYTYNYANQLIRYTDFNNQIMYYEYMPNGLRESKWCDEFDGYGEGLYVYFYYMNGKIVNESYLWYCAERETAGNAWGLNGLVSRTTYSLVDPNDHDTEKVITTGVAVTDMHGDVVMMTSGANDTVVWQSEYNAYGDTTEHSGTFDNPFGYCGEYTDEESGLIYLRARMYDPSVGRFISEDPIKDCTNWYAYCAGNPLKYVDPWGLAPEWLKKIFDTQLKADMIESEMRDNAQKNIQRKIWALGAQEYLREEKGYLTSAWMLEHSLQDNPSAIWRGDDSRIAGLIKESNIFNEKLNEVMQNKTKNFYEEHKSFALNEGDLYYSINRCNMWFTGIRQEDGSWIVKVCMTDSYDYTEFTTAMGDGMNASLGTVANDVAVVSQNLGAISEYDVTVEFEVRWP